jgi:FAD dependent oxidoreductase TIGR03364
LIAGVNPSTSFVTSSRPSDHLGDFDLVVVGGGILGLSHALHASDRGLRVAVVERDLYAVGASVRNFGHLCITAQSGTARAYADVAREQWLRIGRQADINLRESGTVVVARTEHETAVLEEFVQLHGPDEARFLTAAETADVLGVESGEIQAGAHLPLDLRVNPLVAVGRLADLLRERGVAFFLGTNVGAVESGQVLTSRGVLTATNIVVAIGHDLDRLFPGLADQYQVERCRLRMMEIKAPGGRVIGPAIFTGLSLLRYGAFAELASTTAVRADFMAHRPELLEHEINFMFTQRPDGALVVGDTHHRGRVEDPFELERSDELLLEETKRLFGLDTVQVLRRWRGVYASSPMTDFLCETPLPGVRVTAVTTGIGMTCSLGFARDSLDSLLHSPAPTAA